MMATENDEREPSSAGEAAERATADEGGGQAGAESKPLDPRFAELARTRDPKLRASLIEDHIPLARYFARRYRGRGVPDDDLEQVAMVGLIAAVDRFDPMHGTQFTTFAGRTILGELRRYFRDRTWTVRVPRRYQQLSTDVRNAVEELSQKLGQSPTTMQVAEHLGVDIEDVLVALDVSESYRTESLDNTAGDDGRNVAPVATGDESFAVAEVNVVFERLLAALPEREQRIMIMRVREGLSQHEIGDRLGISQMHVSRLLRRSLDRFRAALEQT